MPYLFVENDQQPIYIQYYVYVLCSTLYSIEISYTLK